MSSQLHVGVSADAGAFVLEEQANAHRFAVFSLGRYIRCLKQSFLRRYRHRFWGRMEGAQVREFNLFGGRQECLWGFAGDEQDAEH